MKFLNLDVNEISRTISKFLRKFDYMHLNIRRISYKSNMSTEYL